MDCFTDVFTMFLGLGTFQLCCCLWEGQRALWFHQKYLNLCSEDERRSYEFGTTWGWVLGWTIPLKNTWVKLKPAIKCTCQHARKHLCDASKNSTDCTGLGSRMEKLKYLHICVHYQVEVSFSAFGRGKSSSCVDLFTPLIFIVWTKHFSECQNFNLWVN